MPRTGQLALSGIPATVCTSSGIAAEAMFHRPALALGLAGLAGMLALTGLFLTAAETQETIRVWIRHQPERKITGTAAFQVRRLVRRATSRGGALPAGDAGACAQLDIAEPRIMRNLPEIMRIIRRQEALPGNSRTAGAHVIRSGPSPGSRPNGASGTRGTHATRGAAASHARGRLH